MYLPTFYALLPRRVLFLAAWMGAKSIVFLLSSFVLHEFATTSFRGLLSSFWKTNSFTTQREELKTMAQEILRLLTRLAKKGFHPEPSYPVIARPSVWAVKLMLLSDILYAWPFGNLIPPHCRYRQIFIIRPDQLSIQIQRKQQTVLRTQVICGWNNQDIFI